MRRNTWTNQQRGHPPIFVIWGGHNRKTHVVHAHHRTMPHATTHHAAASAAFLDHDADQGLYRIFCLQLTRYRCRKCRQLVATERNVIPADAGVGHRVFHGQRWNTPAPGAAGAADAADTNGGLDLPAGAAAPAGGGGDSSLFLEPLSWMEAAIVGAVQGKLYCPNCQARLGSFNWSGEWQGTAEDLCCAYTCMLPSYALLVSCSMTPRMQHMVRWPAFDIMPSKRRAPGGSLSENANIVNHLLGTHRHHQHHWRLVHTWVPGPFVQSGHSVTFSTSSAGTHALPRTAS